jgi:hypothetical protein
MLLTALMLVVALCLSSVAAFYSIVGLTAIFAGAVVPIVIMGSILEVAKLVVTVWLHEYWRQCRWIMKMYLVPAVGVLMLLTSMGIFGFLSKAHLDQAVPTGDVAAQVSLIDEKIRTERDNIEAARRALAQMDAQVDQRLSRSDDDKGAERAVQIRRAQARERQQLQTDIAAAQKKIAALNEERAPVASQLRKVEAEVGPIKYIAALIYGDNPDANLLERAVRWVIIVLVAVFDPLAVIMLLAGTESWRWARESRAQHKPELPPPQDPEPEPVVTTPEVVFPPRPTIPEPDAATAVPFVPAPEPMASVEVLDHSDDDLDQESDPRVKEAMKLWKSQNPGLTLKGERQRFRQGQIAQLPWMALLEQLPREPQVAFSVEPPANPTKGDRWLRTDTVPHLLHKFNGEGWIQVDKDINDSYAYDQAYIDYLIQEMHAGRYDPDLLSESEAHNIEHRLQEPL